MESPPIDPSFLNDLYYVYRMKGIEGVRHAVQNGANINARDEHGNMLLHRMSYQELAMHGRTLLSLGASVNAIGAWKQTVLHQATRGHDDTAIMEMLWQLDPCLALDVRAKDDATALYMAAEQGHENQARWLLDHGARADITAERRRTLLHAASLQTHSDICLPMLLAYPQVRALVDQQDNKGNTALHDVYNSNGARLTGQQRQERIQCLLQRGARRDIPNSAGDTAYDTYIASDLEREFTRHLLFPALLSPLPGPASLPASLRDDARASDLLHAMAHHAGRLLFPRPHDLTTPLAPGSPAEQAFMRPSRIDTSWHHDAVHIPAALLPLKNEREWAPLFKDAFIAPNGYRIRCLTSSEALQATGDALGHCVGTSDYDADCCTGHVHILAVSTPKGREISTIELKTPDHSLDDMHIVQHKARENTPPPRAADEAADALLDALEENTLRVTPAWGETAASIRRSQDLHPYFRAIGYYPDPVSIQAIHDEFRRDYRRASLGKDAEGRMVYDDIQTEDGHTHRSHYIGGYAVVDARGFPTGPGSFLAHELKPKEGERIVDLRRLDAMSYLRASGLLEHGRAVLRQKEPELAAALEEGWKRQDAEPLTERPVSLPQKRVQREQRAYHHRLAREDAREQDASSHLARY